MSTKRLLRQPYAAYHHSPSGREDAELTHVGRGTPCGEYLRRFWQPVCMTSDLGEVPLKLRILGEDLVAFKDRGGRFGLLRARCLHRGASLEFGRIRERGIQCAYHGLHFDCDGSILDVPFEPDSKRKEVIFQPAYPVHEYNGLVFAYMGPPQGKPAFPIYDLYVKPGTSFRPWKELSPCNWLQVRENEMDPVHITFLHSRLFGIQFVEQFSALPTIEWRETPIGMTYITARRWKDRVVIRSNDMIMPNMCRVAGIEDGEGPSEIIFDRRGGTTNWVVPIDDANCWTIGWDDVETIVGDPALNGYMDRMTRSEGQAVGPFDVGQSGTASYADRQRAPGDWDMWTSQGPITSHEDEILFATDEGVAAYRRLVRAGIRAVEEGRPPTGWRIHPAAQPISTYSHNSVLLVPPDTVSEKDRALCRRISLELAERIFAGDVRPYVERATQAG